MLGDDGLIDPILEYVKRHGIVDKDAMSPGKPFGGSIQKRNAQHRWIVDLHGLTEDAAAQKLRSAIEQCSRVGKREILVIHGKGYHSDPESGPVLKRLVGIMLEGELKKFVQTYVSAPPRDGGEGATIVRLNRCGTSRPRF